MNAGLRDLALVAAGGAAGSVARYLVARVAGPPVPPTQWPWPTFVVNVSGAFVIGLLVVLAGRHGWPASWRPFLAVGVLGGYTTFSAFSLEVVERALAGHALLAGGYALASLVFGAIACGLGMLAGRAI